MDLIIAHVVHPSSLVAYINFVNVEIIKYLPATKKVLAYLAAPEPAKLLISIKILKV